MNALELRDVTVRFGGRGSSFGPSCASKRAACSELSPADG